jgi:tetratricopeptide (TPR) repeat protein
MSDRSESSLALTAALRVDDACLRFEAAWNGGERPRIEDYLGAAAGEERASLLRELVPIEAFHRRAAGERPSAEEYRSRFPDLDPAWLEPPAPPPSASATSPADTRRDEPSVAEDAPPLPPGYDYLALLGRGGMGVVYQARHRALNRVVALKMILSGQYADGEERSRFRREAEAIARLSHPNIVQIYEVGEHQGRPYIALEFLEGDPLSRRLGGTPMPPLQSARLVESLARAVQHAHEAGIVHRDLKPANILPGRGGVVKIVDFGLAKVVAQDQTQTQTGAVVGTPSYMAPEQAAGRTKEVGPPADVYALGAILYEMLVGAPPFRGDSVAATLELVREQEPVPPRQLQPKAPQDLEIICLKCLRKDPRKRYEGAGALADDLACFLVNKPIRARPVGQLERLGRWGRRNPAVAGLLAVVFVLLAGGLTVASRLWWLAEQRRRQAEEHLHQASEQRDLARSNLRAARAAVDEYCLRVSGDERLREGHRPLRKELLQTAVRFYEQFVRQQSDDPDMEAELGRGCLRLSSLTQEIADPMKAIPQAEQARAIFTRLARDHPTRSEYQEELAEALTQLGKLYRSTSQIPRALEASEAAVALRRELAGGAEDSERLPKLGVSLDELGQLYRLHSEPKAAEKWGFWPNTPKSPCITIVWSGPNTTSAKPTTCFADTIGPSSASRKPHLPRGGWLPGIRRSATTGWSWPGAAASWRTRSAIRESPRRRSPAPHWRSRRCGPYARGTPGTRSYRTICSTLTSAGPRRWTS